LILLCKSKLEKNELSRHKNEQCVKSGGFRTDLEGGIYGESRNLITLVVQFLMVWSQRFVGIQVS